MIKPYGTQDSDGRWNLPAAERNKDPILAALRSSLPLSGLVLEIASGTGQHVVHFASALGELTWLPSDPDAEFRTSITNRIQEEALQNVRAPLDLDVLNAPWPVSGADAVLCINMIHVAPWEAAGALIQGSGEVLSDGGVLFLYGPFRRNGAHTAPSNEAFDSRLRGQNPEWGIRDLEDFEQLAERAGLTLEKLIEMPANNLSLVLRYRD